MRIVYASAEVAPYARVGGLSDVVGALPKEIATLGHEPSVFLPLYASIDREAHGITPVADLGPLRVPMGDAIEEAVLHTTSVSGTDGVRVFFVEHEGAFGREGIYVDPSTGHGYADEVERFALFSRAMLEALAALDLAPDVVHLNDHHTAYAAAYLRELYGDTPLAGAGIVEVCTAVMRYGYDIIEELTEGLLLYLEDKGMSSPADLVGKGLSRIIGHGELSREHRVLATVDENTCIGCGACVIACRDGGHQAIEFAGADAGDDARIPKVDDEKCIGCGFCRTVCPVPGCLTMQLREDDGAA